MLGGCLDDDDDSTALVTVDRSAVRLANFVYDCSLGSRPFGLPTRCAFPSTRESFWRWSRVSFTSSLLWWGPLWPCLWTTQWRWPTFGNWGGTRSLILNEIAQRILQWSELHRVTLAPQFILGCHNVLVDSLSRPHQILGSEWTLHADEFRDLCRQWPVMVDLFATSANHRCSVYFSPFRDPQSAGKDAFLQLWDGLLAYAFPPWSVIPRSWRSFALLWGPV